MCLILASLSPVILSTARHCSQTIGLGVACKFAITIVDCSQSTTLALLLALRGIVMLNHQLINTKLKGHDVRFLKVPNPGRPKMVFLPGNLQQVTSLKTLSAGFSSNFEFYAIELPGAGANKPLPEGYSITYLSQCLDDFVQAHICEEFSLVSCSYGTALGVEYAKLASSRLNSLVLAGCMPGIPPEFKELFIRLMSQCLKDPEGFADSYLSMLTSNMPEIPRQRAVLKASLRSAKSHTAQEYMCFIYNTLRLMEYRASELNKIRCPTLCFTGELDPFVTAKHCQNFAGKIPNGAYHAIENADHLFYMQRPQETIELITDFIFSCSEARFAAAA